MVKSTDTSFEKTPYLLVPPLELRVMVKDYDARASVGAMVKVRDTSTINRVAWVRFPSAS